MSERNNPYVEEDVDQTGAEKAQAVAAEAVADVPTTANTPTPAAQPAPEEGPEQIGLNDLDCGYVVGVTGKGNFVFELVGQERDLLKLIGVQKYADMRVQQTFDQTQATGDALVHEVGKALQIMNQKLDAIVQATKKSDTQL